MDYEDLTREQLAKHAVEGWRLAAELRAKTLELKTALLAEINGTPCADDCDPGYRHCAGCEARIKKALQD
jgi:hypothetical protein